MEKGWKGLPFQPISEFYKNRFGNKVYKIPVSIVDDCPNRRGLKGMKVCVFCDEWGSAARAESFTMNLSEQIEKFKTTISKRVHAESFLAYFQAYTNTFSKIESLQHHFETAISFPYVKGIVVGTRPDCISKGVLNLWKEYAQKKFLSVELGIQSFFNNHLTFLERGHTVQQNLDAIRKISEHFEDLDINLGIHLIFGLPNETEEQIIQTAQIINSLPITSVKLHHLHVLKNTPLQELYIKGLFHPIECITYARKIMIFLENLSPKIYIHRLAAHAPRWNELIAPEWTKDKMRTHQFLVDFLRYHKTYQSAKFQASTEEDLILQKKISKNAFPTTDESYYSLQKRMK